jgi:tRNA 2-selenouridine synthase
MVTSLPLNDFLNQAKGHLMFDVRTPLEFQQGHIVGARNLPLFTNEERVQVGTCYKQKGREAAILLGFELIGSGWASFIRTVETALNTDQPHPDRTEKSVELFSQKVFLHCWRGGMRSGAMAWALSMYGFDVYVLQGGYKTCRNYYLDLLKKNYPFIILSGKTGCGKTDLLHALQTSGEQIIDLEALASHQGSAFGSKGKDTQPTQEQFENTLAHQLSFLNPDKRIWLENESMRIGRNTIPPAIFNQMREAHIIDIQIPTDERVRYLNDDYGKLDKEFLSESVRQISKRLGPNKTKLALLAISENRMPDFIRQVLSYYDKTYHYSQEQRLKETIHPLPLDTVHAEMNAPLLLQAVDRIFGPISHLPIQQ